MKEFSTAINVNDKTLFFLTSSNNTFSKLSIDNIRKHKCHPYKKKEIKHFKQIKTQQHIKMETHKPSNHKLI